MKTLKSGTFLIIAISTLFTTKVFSQTNIEQDIKSILTNMWDAIERKDIDGYAAHLHPDFTSFGENDMFLSEGKDLEVRNAVNWTSKIKFIHTDMHNAQVTVKENVAWITYYWTDYGEESGKTFSSKGKSTRIFVNENDKWLCIHAHFTLIDD